MVERIERGRMERDYLFTSKICLISSSSQQIPSNIVQQNTVLSESSEWRKNLKIIVKVGIQVNEDNYNPLMDLTSELFRLHVVLAVDVAACLEKQGCRSDNLVC